MVTIDGFDRSADLHLFVHEGQQRFVIELGISTDHPINAAIRRFDARRHSFADAEVAAVGMILGRGSLSTSLERFRIAADINHFTYQRSIVRQRSRLGHDGKYDNETKDKG